jgi:hypothetical protein
MKIYNIQTAREMELSPRETQEVSRLVEKRPDRMLYRLAEDKMSIVPTQDYFSPEMVHSYWLDLASAKNVDVTFYLTSPLNF